MAQKVKCLLCMHEDLGSIPSTQVKSQTSFYNSSTGGGRDRRITGACSLVLLNWWTPVLVRDSVPKHEVESD